MSVDANSPRSLRPAVFLDRDGTLNVDTGYTHRPEDLQFLPGVIPGLKALQALGFPLFILTNQSGVARGYFSESELAAFHATLLAQLQAARIHIEGIYYCPFHPTDGIGQYRRDSPLRKPRPGMFFRAAAVHQLDLTASIAIGDKLSDVLAGQAAGCRTILLQTGHAGSGEPQLQATPDFVATNLRTAADWVAQNFATPTAIPHVVNSAYPPAQLDGASR
jgi:D-glycero-D-manno-heptose 1,7-bisphosphate phosphatase